MSGGILVRSAYGKLQEITNSKDLTERQFITGQPIGSSRRGLDTIAMMGYLVADDIIEAGSTNNLVILTGHTAKKGDFLRINTSANSIEETEVSIDEIVDANSFRLGAILSSDLSAGDTVSIIRMVTPRVDSTGATLATFSPTAIMFRQDGSLQEVTEDTATPANNAPLPVKLVDFNGDINISAGDLNVQLSHTGATFDSLRVGNGTNVWAINASLEGLVHDTAALAAISANGTILSNILLDTSALVLRLPTTIGQKANAASLAVSLSTEQQVILAAIKTATETSATASSGGSTAAKQDLLLAELQLKADLTETQPVSVSLLPLPTGASTSAKQDTGNTSLSSIDGKLTGVATSAKQDTGNTSMGLIATAEGAPADAAVTNPASSASVIAALKGLLTLITSTNTKLDTIDQNTSAAFNSTTNVTVAANTLSNAPANAVGMIIQNSTEAASALRFTNSGTTPTASVGFFLSPGQSTSYMPASSIRTISFDGGLIDACITWFV